MFKGKKLFKDSYRLNRDSYQIQDIEKIREYFNQAFKDNNVDIFVYDDFTVINEEVYYDLDPNSNPLLNKYFFFPSHKLYLFDGSKKHEIGVRICFVKEGMRGIKCRVFDITSKQYQSISSWSKAQEFFDKKLISDNFENMYSSYMSVCNKIVDQLKTKPCIVYTTQSGWVEGGRNWFYVPVSACDEDDLLYSKSLKSKYRMNPSTHLTKQEAFQQTWSMLDIADKKITLPLLSYTFLSLITSLMNYSPDKFPKFIVCICGSNKQLDRQGFANFFCNLYDRKMNIFSLNSLYHINSDIDKKMLEEKFSKIRDGILILNAGSRQKLIDKSIQGMRDFDADNMLLILNEKKLDKEFVLNLDISDLDINSRHLEHLRQTPDLLASSILHATEFFRRVFQLEDTSNKKKVEKHLRKRYKYFRKLLERDDIQQEEDKLHIYSCLLIGLDLLLNLVKNDLPVFSDKIGEEKVQAYMNEAMQLFQQECTIEDTSNMIDSKMTTENNEQPIKDEHIVFLKKLFEVLPTPMPRFQDKNNNPDIFAWTDKKDENIIWIKNSVFQTILLSICSKFEELDEDERRSTITKYKTRIYEKLRSNEISVILPKNDDPQNSTIKIGTTEKHDYTGNRAIGTRKPCSVFKMDRRRAEDYLNSLNN